MLNVIDNSGASMVQCILTIRRKAAARIGDRIVVVVKKQKATAERLRNSGSGGAGAGGASMVGKVKRGDIYHAVIVRTRKEVQRNDGSAVRFGDNACVLINKAGDMVGSRVFGPVGGQELRRKGWGKILSLAPNFV